MINTGTDTFCTCVCVCAHLRLTPCNPTDYSLPGSSAMDAPGKNIGVGFHFLLQGIFPTQRSNPPLLHLLHLEHILYHLSHQGSPSPPFSSVQFSSVTQSCLTLCDPMNHRTPGLPVHHQLPEFTETHVHRVSDAIQPSHPLSSPSPTPHSSQHQGLFQ